MKVVELHFGTEIKYAKRLVRFHDQLREIHSGDVIVLFIDFGSELRGANHRPGSDDSRSASQGRCGNSECAVYAVHARRLSMRSAIANPESASGANTATAS